MRTSVATTSGVSARSVLRAEAVRTPAASLTYLSDSSWRKPARAPSAMPMNTSKTTSRSMEPEEKIPAAGSRERIISERTACSSILR